MSEMSPVERIVAQAVAASGRSFVITDPSRPDNPMVYVNPAFEALTGYRAEEVLGRNCRFLQSPSSDPASIALLREAVARGGSASTVILNRRADGSEFWNEVSVSPVVDDFGAVTHFVGVQADVTARVLADQERIRALAAETEARSLLESVLETAPVGLGFWDRSLRYTNVNDALAKINGLTPDEHRGRRPTDVLGALGREVEAFIRSVLETGEAVIDLAFTGETAAAPGVVRHWRVSYYPVAGPEGEVVSVGAVVTEVTDQRRAEARQEHLHTRLRLQARSMEILTDNLHLTAALDRFAAVLVPELAHWVHVHLADDDGSLALRASAVRDDDVGRRMAAAVGDHLLDGPRSPTMRVFRMGVPLVVTEADEEHLAATARCIEDVPALRELAIGSLMVLPMRSRGATIGTLTLIRVRPCPSYDDEDLGFALELTRRISLAVENTQLFERERAVAETLQRALLPSSLPDIRGVEVCVRYVAGTDGVDVGGDWYDVLPLADGRIGLTIGDVVGHDVHAAAKMGELRTTLRAFAAEGAAPSEVVSRLDRYADVHAEGFAATLIYGTLDPATGRFTYVRAGHLPPVLVRPEGGAELVAGSPSPPLGIGIEHHEAVLDLAPGSTLLLYTDGLVERRGEVIDEGLSRLVEAASAPADSTGDLCDAILGALDTGARSADDIAVLAVRRRADPPDG